MKSILFIRGGAIGDFVLTLPGMHVMREKYPDARIEILGYPHIAQLAYKRFYADAVSSIDNRHVAAFFAKNGELDSKLCNYFSSFDLIVSFLYDPDGVFVDNLKKAGVRNVILADGTPSKNVHATEHLSKWLTELRLEMKTYEPRLYPSEEDLYEATSLFSLRENQQIIGIHPGSGSKTKNWNVDNFIKVSARFIASGKKILVFHGPADEEVVRAFKNSNVAQACQFCGSMPLSVVAGALKKCSVFLGHDSGISHMAAALDVPTIALFGPTNPEIWAPRGLRVRVIQNPNGLNGVSVEEVKSIMESFF